jgi:heptosyltransferase-1
MKRVLIIKTSSLGDIVHTLPAINDASLAIPDIKFDWIIEENFSEIPTLNDQIDQIIPVSIRKWRKNLLKFRTSKDFSELKRKLSLHHYDAIIDAQGLLKSAWLASKAFGNRYGFDWASAREPLASIFYHRRINVPKDIHAVERIRILFSKSLGYVLNSSEGNFNLTYDQGNDKYVILMHGTTWFSKHWPEESWIKLSCLLSKSDYKVVLLWGNDQEKARAERIAKNSEANVLPKMKLTDIVSLIAKATGCISVDTGLGHLSSAMGKPTLGIYGPTNPVLTGLYGSRRQNFLSDFPCLCMSKKCPFSLREDRSCRGFEELTADIIYDKFIKLVGDEGVSNGFEYPKNKEKDK